MTPQEQASHLVNKFYQLRAYETMSDAGKRACWEMSKESTKIAAQLCHDEASKQGNEVAIIRQDYWTETLKAIDTL